MNDRSTVSWRRQALLWPAICSALASIFAVLWVAALGGSTTTWGSILAVSAWVPIAVVVSVFAFGGGAIVIGLAVRTFFRRFVPNAPVPLRTGAVAVVTGGGETLGTMLTAAAARGDTGTSTWTFAVGIGIVATLASSIYARGLFAEVPEPFDWDREV